MDEREMLYSLSFFKRYLPEVRLFYAIKSNPHPLVVKFFQQQGLSFDVASGQEADLVLANGTTGKDTIFTNPIKNSYSLEQIFSKKIAAYTFDNGNELEKIAAFRKAHGCEHNPLALLRIRLESEGVQINLNHKFGCSLKDAPLLIKKAADLGLNPGGIAFHVGTQSLMAKNYAMGIQNSIAIAKTVREQYGINLSVIDVGGGFPDPFFAEQEGISLHKLFAEIGHYCQQAIEAGFTLYAEPGRVLVSAAGTLIASVIGINQRRDRQWVYLDDGIYGCYSGRIFDHKRYQFLPLQRNGKTFSQELVPCVVAGPTCDSIDIIDESALLPKDIAMGDLLCSVNMGAYSWATACNFNGFAPAQTLLVRRHCKMLAKQIAIVGLEQEQMELSLVA
jgi:ornithine decarboxylase